LAWAILRNSKEEWFMAVPAIVWRNPKSIERRRVWTPVRRDSFRSLYLVMESPWDKQFEAKGLPNLEIIQGGATAPVSETANKQRLPSRG
jgi:hypothetical protein